MLNYLRTLLVSASLSLAIAGPALAHDDDHDDEHEQLGWDHGQGHRALENRHDDVHKELSDEHRGAHYYDPYMSRWEDERLHEQLNQGHAWQDNQLNREHHEQHRDLDDEHQGYHGSYSPYGRSYYSPAPPSYFYFGW